MRQTGEQIVDRNFDELERRVRALEVPEIVTQYHLRIQGQTTSHPLKDFGLGWSISRVSTGRYKNTPLIPVGQFLDAKFTYMRNAPAAGAGILFQVDFDSLGADGSFEWYTEDPGTEAVAPALYDLTSTDRVGMLLIYGARGLVV